MTLQGGVAHTQSCRLLIDTNLADDIRFMQIGGHYLIYIEQSASFVLLNLLHQRVDLTQHLARVSPPQRS